MKTCSSNFVLVALLALGLYAAGWWVGHQANRLLRASSPAADNPARDLETTALPQKPGGLDRPGAPPEHSAFLPASMTTSRFVESKLRELLQSDKSTFAAGRDEWRRLVFLLSTNEYPLVWDALKYTPSQRSLVYAWAREDPPGALRAVLTLPSNTDRDNLVESVLIRWAAIDPDGAVAWLHQLPPNERRDHLLRSAVGGMAGRHPAAARKLIEEIPPGASRDNAIMDFIDECSSAHPEAAAALAKIGHAVFQRQGLFKDVGMGWAERDVAGALAWAQSLSNSADRRDALAGVVRTMVQTQPEEACRFVLSQTDGDTRGQLVQSAARGWAEADLPAAAHWLSNLAEPSLRQVAWEGLSRSWVAQDPEGAVTFALGSLPAGPIRNAALETIGREWTQSGWDERAARQYAEQMAVEVERDAFLAGLVTPEWRVER